MHTPNPFEAPAAAPVETVKQSRSVKWLRRIWNVCVFLPAAWFSFEMIGVMFKLAGIWDNVSHPGNYLYLDLLPFIEIPALIVFAWLLALACSTITWRRVDGWLRWVYAGYLAVLILGGMAIDRFVNSVFRMNHIGDVIEISLLFLLVAGPVLFFGRGWVGLILWWLERRKAKRESPIISDLPAT